MAGGKINKTATNGEQAIVKDNGNRNGYTVNFSSIRTKTYHDKFENLTKRKVVNEGLYQCSLEILENRSGTEYESLVILDAWTGKRILINDSASGSQKFQCGLSQKQYDELEKLGKKFEGLHNHPNNSFPSMSDIVALFIRRLQASSTIVCHDGTVYRLEKLGIFDEIKEFVSQKKKEIADELPGYPDNIIETRTAKKVIDDLQKKKILRFKEVP